MSFLLSEPLDDVAAASLETRQLRETIVAMRAEMDHLGLQHQAALQHAVTSNQSEVQQLHETVQAMRAELDHVHTESARALHHATAAAQAEVAELRATLITLRASLERQKIMHEDEMQTLRREDARGAASHAGNHRRPAGAT